MFICPECNKGFELESALIKHLSRCWREKHPNHKSKDAPRSEDINTRNINNDVLNFFNSLK